MYMKIKKYNPQRTPPSTPNNNQRSVLFPKCTYMYVYDIWGKKWVIVDTNYNEIFYSPIMDTINQKK